MLKGMGFFLCLKSGGESGAGRFPRGEQAAAAGRDSFPGRPPAERSGVRHFLPTFMRAAVQMRMPSR